MPNLIDDLVQMIEFDQKSARSLLIDLAERLPDSAQARALLARTYLRALEIEPALETFRVASALDPNDVGILNQIGLCLVALGRYDAALTAFERAGAKQNSSLSPVLCALMQHRLGKIEGAVRTYNQLIPALKPNDPERWHAIRGLGLALRDAGSPIAADHCFRDLIREYRVAPREVALSLVERDNSLDFHEWTRLAHKDSLAVALKANELISPNTLAFPETFVLPADRPGFLTFAASRPGVLVIGKPLRGTGGQGIVITRNLSQIAERDDIVVQHYVERPLLIGKLKSHMRVYGLVTSAEPFRAYIYREGIVRFAPEEYDLSDQGVANPHAHITNTARHRGRSSLVIESDPTKEDSGHIWSLSAFLNRAQESGAHKAAVWQQLRAMMTEFLRALVADGLFARQSAASPRRAFAAKLFGLDVLLDADGKAWLLEVQRKPALGGSPLANRINDRLCRTIFEMSSACAIDDSLSAEMIGKLAKDADTLRKREEELEMRFRGEFERL